MCIAALVSACVVAQTVPAGRSKATSVVRPKAAPKASQKDTRAPARTPAVELRAALTPAELEIAPRVHVGSLPCELGQTVVLTPDPASPGLFSLRLGKDNYRVTPLETTTGAIRLEDKVAGVVWLQLANKSMLMSQKLGKRLADECKSPAQILVAEAMLKDPPPSVLDAPAVPAIATPAAIPPAIPPTSVEPALVEPAPVEVPVVPPPAPD